MNTINIGSTKYTFGLRVAGKKVDPVVIYGKFVRIFEWLLLTGFWNDEGYWDDNSNWID